MIDIRKMKLFEIDPKDLDLEMLYGQRNSVMAKLILIYEEIIKREKTLYESTDHLDNVDKERELFKKSVEHQAKILGILQLELSRIVNNRPPA